MAHALQEGQILAGSLFREPTRVEIVRASWTARRRKSRCCDRIRQRNRRRWMR
jgi:hypothetical protein